MRVVSLCCILFALCGLFLTGCASQNLSADADPSLNLEEMSSFYVQRLPADTRGVGKLIAAELLSLGKEASHGDTSTVDPDVDAIVTYVDKWMWDITMYMIELRVEIRDPDTQYILASGQSFRTSLVRKSPEEMVKEVIAEIMKEAEGL